MALLKNFQGDINTWASLSQHELSSSVENLLNSVGGFELTIENARGPVANMDEFSIHIQNLPMSPEMLLDHVRKNLNSFVDTSISEFLPYSEDDNTLWQSSSPLGSMFSIQFMDPLFNLNIDDGTVITSHFSNEKWIFTTSWSPADGQHPVSGNREFGFIHNGDGTIEFDMRGVDRITTQFHSGGQYFTGAVFGGADSLWESFQRNLNDYIQTIGGVFSINEPIKNRIDWDLVGDILLGNIPIPDCN